MNTSLPPILKKSFSYFFILLMLTQAYSCKYYKVRRATGDNIAYALRIDKSKNQFIIHQNDNEVYSITGVTADSSHVSGYIKEAGIPIHYFDTRKRTKYVAGEESIIHEVHIYLRNNAPQVEIGFTKVSFNDIRKIDIIEKDTGKMVVTYVLSGIGVVAIIAIIVLLTKSSCPYVYVNDGEGFVFQGETFGGAIMSNMERDDYMPLPLLQPVNGEYQLRITNELKEKQYTDIAQLMVVNHSSDQKVLLDKYGNLQVINSPILPKSAISHAGNDLKDILATDDQRVFFFNELEINQNGVLLEFKKPRDATEAKLLFSAKNTLWFDYVYGKFVEKFGKRFDKWMNKTAKNSTEDRLEKMLANDVPLSVFVKINDRWKLVEYLPTVGPLAEREFVIPIDLSEIHNETIEVKIETGFMFWEMDYAAMDFTPNKKVQVTYLNPSSAMGTGGMDWTNALSQTDQNYMAQLRVGDVTQLQFDAMEYEPMKNQSQTVFLHTRGYYELIRNFKGKPKVKQLEKFKTPGYFSTFSKTEYLKTLGKELDEPVVIAK